MWEAPRVREALICAPLLGVERVALEDILAIKSLRGDGDELVEVEREEVG